MTATSAQSIRWGQVDPEQLQDPRVRAPVKTTLALLSTYAHGTTRLAYPRQGLLAAELGIHRDTVRGHLQELESLGWLTREAVTARDKGLEPSNRRLQNDYTLRPVPGLFGMVTHGVLSDPNLKAGPKALYALLATRADRVGRIVRGCSRQELAQALAVKRRATISEWAAALSEAGYLEIQVRSAADLPISEDTRRQVANDYKLLDQHLLPEPELTDFERESGVSSRTHVRLTGIKRALLVNDIASEFEDMADDLPFSMIPQPREVVRGIAAMGLDTGAPPSRVRDAMLSISEVRAPLTGDGLRHALRGAA